MENEEFFRILEENDFEKGPDDSAYYYTGHLKSMIHDICIETNNSQIYGERIVEWAPGMIGINTKKDTYSGGRGYLYLENIKKVKIYYEASTIVIRVC